MGITKRIVVACGLLAFVGSAFLVAEPASASFSDCPVGYNCWWVNRGGAGDRKQYAGTNYDIHAVTQSGWNRRTIRACGYAGPNLTGGVNYSRPANDQENYSLREIRSNKFTTASTC